MSLRVVGQMARTRPPWRLGPVSDTIIPKGEAVSETTVRLPDALWRRLKEIAETETKEAREEGRPRVSRDQVIEHLCRWGIRQWEAEREAKKRKK